jgi:hypothetical protein
MSLHSHTIGSPTKHSSRIPWDVNHPIHPSLSFLPLPFPLTRTRIWKNDTKAIQSSWYLPPSSHPSIHPSIAPSSLLPPPFHLSPTLASHIYLVNDRMTLVKRWRKTTEKTKTTARERTMTGSLSVPIHEFWRGEREERGMESVWCLGRVGWARRDEGRGRTRATYG